MDFLSKRSMDVTALAMDALSARHKALAGNIANANTPGYKRVDVSFEGQLQGILSKEYEKDDIKAQNSQIAMNNHYREVNATNLGLKYTPNAQTLGLDNYSNASNSINPKLLEDNYKDFNAQIMPDNEFAMEKQNGNNVNIESEMIESVKTGTQYSALSQLMEKGFRGVQDVIRGGGA
ncbi:MAG: flagellar basal body protein [bacterium]